MLFLICSYLKFCRDFLSTITIKELLMIAGMTWSNNYCKQFLIEQLFLSYYLCNDLSTQKRFIVLIFVYMSFEFNFNIFASV